MSLVPLCRPSPIKPLFKKSNSYENTPVKLSPTQDSQIFSNSGLFNSYSPNLNSVQLQPLKSIKSKSITIGEIAYIENELNVRRTMKNLERDSSEIFTSDCSTENEEEKFSSNSKIFTLERACNPMCQDSLFNSQ